jgi:MYXO-CTERM domain-containing protein
MTTRPTVPASPVISGCATVQPGKRFLERWSFAGMAILMLATSIAGFAPAILDTAGRRGPVSAFAAIHGIVFFVWLLLFLVQSLLIRSGWVLWHRRLGMASFFVLLFMVPLGYETTIAMVRRGYDLSGDQGVGFSTRGASLDPQTASVFNLIDLAWFALLALGALWFRRRPAIHKRLMLFANIQLMGASLTHLLGHTGLLTVGTVIGSFSLFLLAAVARDWLVDRRIHPLTTALAIISFVLLPIEGALIGPSATWHYLIGRLAGSA